MKGNNKIIKWMITSFMLLTAVVILAGGLLPYLQMNISSLVKLLPDVISDIFDDITVLLGSEKGKISFSALTLFRVAFGTGNDTVAADLLHSLGIIILIPYVVVVISAIFSLVRRRWSYILSAVFALSGLVIMVISVIKIIPSTIYNAIPTTFQNMLTALPVEFGEKILRDFVMKGIGIAWWIGVAGCVVLLGLSIVGLIVAVRKEGDEPAGQQDPTGWLNEGTSEAALPEFLGQKSDENAEEKEFLIGKNVGISIGFGELNGSEIPLSDGEMITIGSDRNRCNVVTSVKEIESIHCRIKYDMKNEFYQVVDMSKGGVYVNGRRIVSGKPVLLPPGTILFLANKHAVGLL